MEIFFVRHGETDFNVAGRIQGGMDIPLNNTGIEQANKLAEKCAENEMKFDAVFSSSKLRASKTADIVSKRLGLHFEVVEGLEEIDLGEWQGLTWAEVKEKYKDNYNEWFKNRRYTKVINGESHQDMIDRVFKALKKLIDLRHERILVVTHSAVIMCMQCIIKDVPFNEMTNYKPKNAELVKFDSQDFLI
jgi:probable phosphoglycerate mutase